ncbi:MAG: FAD-dependent thymidylate synthase [Actinomycetota bacterium]|nr:FAD-dependent thymidylate synthase [Actinomycetota bacterium]MDP8953653.1 FAD-dependent thymidylate synthase [Actinomycetota bacterium]
MSVPSVATYVREEFSPAETDVLRRYVTNVEGPVFALVNLPEVVKGALFARYSRTHKSLRRLFLDEFVGDLDIEGDLSIDATVGLERAERLYDRVFLEYGDDSVAQLGGVHLACEQASNILTKVLEWGRLMSYLEQSTRYIAYDDRLGGRYRYYRDPELLASPLGTRYVGDMDRLFDTYAELVPLVQEWCRQRYPKQAGDSDFVHRQSTRAKALDAVRGVLPAASLSNVGIYGNGQGYEALLMRMRAHPLPEARAYAELMLSELRKVIPSFLTRIDRPERGGAWTGYLRSTREATAEVAAKLFAGSGPPDDEPSPEVTLVDFDPDGEDKLLTAMLYGHLDVSEVRILDRVRELSAAERSAVVAAYVGERTNRRHKPGRALERISYRFDVCADYGAFRDLQRHRMLTIEWQPLSPTHGYSLPETVMEAGGQGRFAEAMERSAALYDELEPVFPQQSSYAVSLAYRLRFSLQLNAREAMHMLELRTTPQGHPSYRRLCQQMHRLIAEQAGHRAVAELMRFVDHGEPELERLEAERQAETRRLRG